MYAWASLVAQLVKNLPSVQETQFDPWLGRSHGEGMATHSSFLALRIPWTEAWQATVHGVTKSQTQLSMHAHKPLCIYQYI